MKKKHKKSGVNTVITVYQGDAWETWQRIIVKLQMLSDLELINHQTHESLFEDMMTFKTYAEDCEYAKWETLL